MEPRPFKKFMRPFEEIIVEANLTSKKSVDHNQDEGQETEKLGKFTR